MGYVIAGLLVLLIVAGFAVFLARNSARKSTVSDASDPGAEQNSLAIIGSDEETPAGSTTQHSSAEPAKRPARREDHPDTAPAVNGGEAEGRRSTR
jgi:hypothetical protein